MTKSNSLRVLIETVKVAEEVYQVDLPVDTKKLYPVFTEETMNLHYNLLYKNYVKKAIETSDEFAIAGAKLHMLFFEQFAEAKAINNPTGPAKELINRTFGDFDKFKDSFSKAAIGIQGSGWCYLDTTGVIRTINNHKLIKNVAVIIDMWEHSYLIDFRANKERYLKEIWRVINWNIVNARLNNK